MPPMNQRIVLKRRPSSEPTLADFELVEAPAPAPGAGEILCRTLYLSLDPYMRGRMNDVRSYAPSVELGQVMVGGTVSEVVESHDPALRPGDVVGNYVGGWVRAGKIRYREEIVEGLAGAPEAFIGLLRGRNTGKMLVKVA